MTTTEPREIDHEEALALLERTDRRNGFRGIGRNAGPSTVGPTALGIALEVLAAGDRRLLRPSSAAGFSILEIRNPKHGWLSYFVYTGSEHTEEKLWP